MRKYFKIITTLLLLIFFSISTKAGEKLFSVAASEFKTQGGDASMLWLGPSCADAIVNRISTDKKVRIVEREYINKIIEELKLQMTGLVDEETALEVGRIIGANYFIFGTVSILGANVVLNARVVNVETAEIISTSRVSGKLDHVFQLQEDLAKKISTDLSFNSVIFASDNVDVSEISFSVYSKLDQLKKIATDIPLFKLDPTRKRKVANYMQGINICDDLLSLNPKLYLAHYYKGLFSIHLEDNSTANLSTKVAQKLNPNDVNVVLLRASYFLITKDYTKAKILYKYITGKYTSDSRAWYGLAKTYMKIREDNLAIESLINSLAGSKFIEQAQSNLRTLVAGTQQLQKANFTEVKYYNSAMLYRAFWNEKQAITTTIYNMAKQTAIDIPNLYLSFYLQAFYEKERKQIVLAEQNYKKCLQRRATFPAVHRELSLLYFENRKCTKAKQHEKLYLATALVVNDYAKFERVRRNCN